MSIIEKVSFIMPVSTASDKINSSLKSIANQQWPEVEIICLLDKNLNGYFKKNIAGATSCVVFHRVDFNTDSIPKILNRGISSSTGEVVFLTTDFVYLHPNFTSRFTNILYSDHSIGYAYGNFIEEQESGEELIRETRTDNLDFSESSQIGPVRGLKRDVFKEIGLYDQNLYHSYEYDLRLRIFEKYNTTHIDEPLYKVMSNNPNSSCYNRMKHFYCYIPSHENTYRHSYLKYSREEEAEFREICFKSLKRRGAILNHNFIPLSCPHNNTAGPQVSVVIPLYNRSEYIREAIESVLSSTWNDFEIIIVDNGSTDGSIDIAEEYRNNGDVKLIRNNINNTAKALNLSTQIAKGKYICQLDSDDLYAPKTLETLFSYMESNPDCALGVSYYDHIGPDSETLEEFGIVKHTEYDRNNLIRTDGMGAARIWHRCVLEELGGFDEENLGSYGEDYDLELKLSEKYEVLKIPHVLYHYRINHKKTVENVDYNERHRKKTFARKSAIIRRQSLNKNKRLPKGSYDNKHP